MSLYKRGAKLVQSSSTKLVTQGVEFFFTVTEALLKLSWTFTVKGQIAAEGKIHIF